MTKRKQHKDFEAISARQHVTRKYTKLDMTGVMIVDRTPCTYCGVRADVGCRHQAPAQPEAFNG